MTLSDVAPAAGGERTVDSDDLATTREALHAVCEHVLAAALHAQTGRIGLAVSAAGFCTPPFGPDDQVITIGPGDITVIARSATRSQPLTTLRAAAQFVGVEPAAPADVYTPATSADPDAMLPIDADAADALIGWYAKVSAALRSFAPDSRQTLWPEHFDVAIRIDDCNFGGLAGDTTIADPYVYVGPPSVPPSDSFFTFPFGAARTWDEAPQANDIAAFFADGARCAVSTTSPADEPTA